MRSRPRQLKKNSINTGSQISFGTHSSQLQKCKKCALQKLSKCASLESSCSYCNLYSWFRLGLSIGYGLDFLLCVLALERGTLHWLATRPRVCFQNHSLSRLRCSGVALAYGWVTILLYCLWLNKHTYYFLTGYGTTLSLYSLTIGR